MADNVLIIEVEIDGKNGFAKLSQDLIQQGKQQGERFSSEFAENFADNIAGKFKGLLLGAIAGVFAGFAKAAVDAAVEAEQAQLSLANSLTRVGGLTSENIAAFNSLATELQKTTKLTDEQAVSLIALANNYARSGEEAEKLVKAAIDLSAATGVDSQAAIEGLGRSISGVGRGLNTLIPGFKSMSEEALKAGAAIEFVNSKFGGSAQAQYDGAAAGLSKISKGFNEVLESTGRFFTGSREASTFLSTIAELMFMLAKAIDSASASFDSFIRNLREAKSSNIFIQGMQLVIGALDVTKKKLEETKVVLDADMVAFQQLGQVVGNQSSKFTAYAAGANVAASALDILKGKINDYGLNLQGVNQLSEDQATKLLTAIQAIESYKLSLEPLIAMTAEQVLQFQKLSAELLNLGFTSQQLNGMSIESMNGVLKNFQAITQAFRSGVVNAIVGGISAITKALVTGKDGFKAFLNAVLNIIGDMLIQIGGALIAIGLGVEAIKASLLTLTGGPALAAGLALVVLGTLLKSLGSGGDAGAASGAAAGGGFIAGGGPGTFEQPISTAPKATEVVINVQGNVLDRRESGLEIASVLQEYFDTNNGVLARA